MCCLKTPVAANRTCKSQLTSCQKTACVCGRGPTDDDSDQGGTSWEDLLPELDTDEGEPFDPLPEFGEPPPWADLDDWDSDDD